jgi:hypothetical protein
MNFFRLQDNTQKQEFIQNGFPAIFLNQLQDINLIIGANNSRKSRFLRHIIKQEHKLIIHAAFDFNEVYLKSKDIFNALIQASPQHMNETMFGVSFTGLADADHISQGLNNYFSVHQTPNNTLTFGQLDEHLKNINEQLLTAAVEDNLKVLKELISLFLPLLTVLERIYKSVQENDHINPFPAASSTITRYLRFQLPTYAEGNHVVDSDIKYDTISRLKDYFEQLNNIEFTVFRNAMTYIPVLRTSRMLVGTTEDIFKQTIISQYKLDNIPKLNIDTGLALYDRIELARNGDKKNREDFSEFELFISEVFFQSRTLDIVAQRTSDRNEKHIKLTIGGELDDVAIFDLGDGIQAVINLLFPIFTAPEQSWIFIDEPENHLHPGYQNVLIKAISENKTLLRKKHRYFINTHSNHILSESLLSSAKTEVLVFNRNDSTSSTIKSFSGNEYTTLEMLGVFNTSVLISNCTLWVEGVTDRLYLRAFIFAYCNDKENNQTAPLEGMNYSFIEYAGNNLIHYDFVNNSIDPGDQLVMKEIKSFFINSNVFLLADSDFNKELKHEFYNSIGKDNFIYYNTEVPEIENLIPDELLKQWLIEQIKCEKTEVDSCFELRDNSIKLGLFFTDKFGYGKGFRKFTSKGEGGTLRSDYKKSLADYVYKNILEKRFEWSHLKESADIVNLMQNLLTFIKNKNLL